MKKQLSAKGDLIVKPVTAKEWADLQQLFSEPGVQKGCWCMYWRTKRSVFDKLYGEGNRIAMQQVIESGRIPGLLAYLHGRPVAWCSVAPRTDFPVLDRSHTLKRIDDQAVWSIVCFFISKPYRNSGLSAFLIGAAVSYAAAGGARVVEAYPLSAELAQSQRNEAYMGLTTTFLRAGFEEVARRSERRAIMRYSIDRS